MVPKQLHLKVLSFSSYFASAACLCLSRVNPCCLKPARQVSWFQREYVWPRLGMMLHRSDSFGGHVRVGFGTARLVSACFPQFRDIWSKTRDVSECYKPQWAKNGPFERVQQEHGGVKVHLIYGASHKTTARPARCRASLNDCRPLLLGFGSGSASERIAEGIMTMANGILNLSEIRSWPLALVLRFAKCTHSANTLLPLKRTPRYVTNTPPSESAGR